MCNKKSLLRSLSTFALFILQSMCYTINNLKTLGQVNMCEMFEIKRRTCYFKYS